MQAWAAYNEGMSQRQSIQYTIRKVPPRVDAALRRRATEKGVSLNEVAIEALRQAVNLVDEPVRHHDLDALAGSWVEDPEFDAAIAAQDQVDPEAWK